MAVCIVFLMWGTLASLHADAGFELPIVVAAGDTTSSVFKDVTVNLDPSKVGAARYIRLAVHNLQRVSSGDSMAYLRINNSQGDSRLIRLSNDNPDVFVRTQDKAYGGIGGGFHTVRLRIDLSKLVREDPDGGADIPMTLEQTNTIRFYIDQQSYSEGASAYRVIWMRVTDANWNYLLASTPQSYWPGGATDSGQYIEAVNDNNNRSAGKLLWETEVLQAKPGAGNIRAKCMDCHTRTGYDLKYFGYSNESIFKRARFHGLSADKAKLVTLYIRTLKDKENNTIPSHGRPWNPPYQPGKVRVAGEWQDLSSLPIERWAAGAGVWRVLSADEKMVQHVFGTGSLAEVESAFRLSSTDDGAPYLGLKLVDIPIHLQLPDWNRWLPRVHPVDIWSDFKSETIAGNDPYKAYTALVGTIDDEDIPINGDLSELHRETLRFLRKNAALAYKVSGDGVVKTGPHDNVFREASSGNTGRLRPVGDSSGTIKGLSDSSAPYKADMFDEYAKRALTHWEGVKYFEVFHEGRLEDQMGVILGDPKITNEDRGWGLAAATVFNNAPHKTASNTMYWEGRTNYYDSANPTYLDGDDQRPVEGLYSSVVWYHLEAILNPGNKQLVSVSNAVDWDYNYQLLYRLADYSGEAQGMLYATTLMKNWQVRDIKPGAVSNMVDGVQLSTGTKLGWGLRTCTPFMAYSFDIGMSDVVGVLDEYSPQLYKFFLSTALRRWMEVVKHEDFPFRYYPDNVNSGLHKLDEWPREASENRSWSLLPKEDYQPTEWDGHRYMFDDGNSADTFWRLLPLLDQVGVDKDVLNDFKGWCAAAWPGPDASPNDWSQRIAYLGYAATHVLANRAYRFENMEFPGRNIRSTFWEGSTVTTSKVKDYRATWRARSAAGQWLYLNQVLGYEGTRLYAREDGSVRLALSAEKTGEDVMWRALSIGDGKVRLQGKAGKISFINVVNEYGNIWHGKYGFWNNVYFPNRGNWKLVTNPWEN